jgi:Putative phage serine protease XkdF
VTDRNITININNGDGGQAAKGTWDGETIVTKAAKTVWDQETIATRVLKSEPERRYTLNVIYPADKADIGKALDGHRDFASKEVVEEAAWNYMRNYRSVGTFHTPAQAARAGGALKADGAAELVESYVYRGPDWELTAADGSEFVVKSGDWLGGFIWSPEDWELIQAGEIGGVSVEGGARRKKATPGAKLRGNDGR